MGEGEEVALTTTNALRIPSRPLTTDMEQEVWAVTEATRTSPNGSLTPSPLVPVELRRLRELPPGARSLSSLALPQLLRMLLSAAKERKKKRSGRSLQ